MDTQLVDLAPALVPLSGTARQQVQQILRAYGDFWTNVAFQKGWAKPVFRFVDVQPQLETAAEIVVRIRNLLDEQSPDPSAKIHRMAEGSVREYLWTVTKKPDTKEEQEEFVRVVIHANFCDAAGYVEGLSKETVDQLIESVFNGLDEQEEKLRSETQLEEKLAKAWEETSVKIKELFQHKDPGVLAKLADVRAAHITKVLEHLEAIDKELGELHGAKGREAESKKAESPREEPKTEGVKQVVELRKSAVSLPQAGADEEQPAQPSSPEIGQEDGTLQVQKVADEVANIKGEIKDLLRQADTLREKELSLHPEAAAKEVEDLQYKCMKYANLLMDDLLALDSMVGISQQARPLKKEQVLNIQSMLEDVDAMKKKLMDLKHHLPEQKAPEETQAAPAEQEKEKVEEPEAPAPEKKAEEETPAPAKAEEPATAAPEKKAEEEAQPAVVSMEEEDAESKKRKLVSQSTTSRLSPAKKKFKPNPLSKQWRAMKLKPRMQVAEHPDCFVVSTYVPQMKLSDINVKTGPDTLTIEGVREPTLKEETAMRNQMKDRYKALTGKEFDYVCLDEDEDIFLLQMGAGRFGRFQETYKVPPYVDLDKVQSLYQGGRLVVIIPFKKQYTAPQIRTRAPQERAGVTHPFAGHAFAEDEDFWW